MRRAKSYEVLDGATEGRLVRQLKIWTVALVVALAVASLAVMLIRQLDPPGWGWQFDSNEFGAIGQWFSGLASAVALWSAVALVLNDRRRQDARDRLAVAERITYAYRGDPRPHWVIHNGSSRPVQIVKVGGHPELDKRWIYPQADIKLKDATLIAAAGYRGDQPKDVLRFDDGEYEWTRTDSNLRGKRRQ